MDENDGREEGEGWEVLPGELDSSAVDSNPRLETEVKRCPLLKVVQRGWRASVVLGGGVVNARWGRK